MNILHIHQDYPDGRPYPYTKAVENLINGVEKNNTEHQHFVLSINRTSNPFKVSIKPFEQGLSVVYFAIPIRFVYYPVMLFWFWLVSLHLKKYTFDVIHGHKVTTEGLFTLHLANNFSIPYILSLRGGSDIKNLIRFPELRKKFRQIYKQAHAILLVSPWAEKQVTKELGYTHPRKQAFPNICHFEVANPNRNQRTSPFIIILSLHQYKRKGLEATLEAIAKLQTEYPDKNFTIEIIGSGNDKYQKLIKKIIERHNIAGLVNFLGELKHEQVLDRLQLCKTFVLPSINETFGMSYIEALANGCPVIYMKNTGIDGYFEEYDIGIKLREQSVEAVASGLMEINSNHSYYSTNVAKMIENRYLENFTENNIVKKYLKVLHDLKAQSDKAA